MVRRIQVTSISSVLIAGVWYEVGDSTFARESFAFTWRGMPVSDPAVDGFTFKSADRWISGPLSAIQAVRHHPDPADT